MFANSSLGRIAVGATLMLVTSAVAGADGVAIKLEPGVAIPTTAPQSDIYDVGGGQSLKALFALTPYLDIGPAASFLFLPASTPLLESGVAWGFGGGVRLKRPHNKLDSGMSPWLDADLLYMQTGDLARLGFDAAVGVAFPVDKQKVFWVGPFVRYQQTINGERMGYDTRDSKLVLAGLSVEFGSAVKRKPLAARVEIREVAAPAPPPEVIVQAAKECPVVAAAPAPIVYQNVIVTKDKLELKEKLFFAWDRAEIKPTSFSILDEVVKVLNDNPAINLRIEGHTDTSGEIGHNQRLSQRRAESVVTYLTGHGIVTARLTAKGFGPSVPLETNDSADGRERNRRVEFVVLTLTTDGSSK
jgi:outer membrane protein OmpA-like peptidoglycan-associated protein